MSNYSYYFAGSTYKECTDLIRELNCSQLLSQINEKKQILQWVEYKRTHPENKSKFMIDSGAFSVFTRGATVDVDEYIDFMNDIDDAIDYYVQVDKIAGSWDVPATEEELVDAPRLSWENYLYMRSKAKSPKKILPVFHQFEDPKWLENMLEYRDENGEPIDYICISTNKEQSKKSNLEWLEKVWAIIYTSSNPKVKVHALGLAQMGTLLSYKFESSDSTSWLKIASNGGIITPWGTILVSPKSKHRRDHIDNYDDAGLDETLDMSSNEITSSDDSEEAIIDIEKDLPTASKVNVKAFVEELGFKWEDLIGDNPKQRMLFNIRSFKEYEDTGFRKYMKFKNIPKTVTFVKPLF